MHTPAGALPPLGAPTDDQRERSLSDAESPEQQHRATSQLDKQQRAAHGRRGTDQRALAKRPSARYVGAPGTSSRKLQYMRGHMSTNVNSVLSPCFAAPPTHDRDERQVLGDTDARGRTALDEAAEARNKWRGKAATDLRGRPNRIICGIRPTIYIRCLEAVMRRHRSAPNALKPTAHNAASSHPSGTTRAHRESMRELLHTQSQLP